MTKNKSVITWGDFNIHYDDLDNPDIVIYTDTCQAVGLIQYIQFLTHKTGHILDHMFIKAAGTIKVTKA